MDLRSKALLSGRGHQVLLIPGLLGVRCYHTGVLIRRGNPADQILEEANTWGTDCIFVGAKGTRGIDRLLLGSVSSAVSARAHCSVEVVRPSNRTA